MTLSPAGARALVDALLGAVLEAGAVEMELYRTGVAVESKADSFLILESVSESQTKVKWGFTTTFPRPMNIMLVVMDMDALIGKDFADGLDSLKGIMEKK